jgi:poly-gamma-glutamate synthesis protein (capsule biosynthesis protein)
MAAMLEDIRKLKAQVDVLVLSLHWGLHFMRAKLATYQQEVGYAAIDAGADIIIGTHAHILKGFEVYKGKVIFYSLCNFILDSSMRGWPNISPEKKEIISAYNWVIEPEWANTYPHPPDSRKTIVVKITMADKRIEKVSFLPTMINIKAQPRILPRTDPGFNEVLKYMDAITEEAGLNGRYKVEGEEAVVLI